MPQGFVRSAGFGRGAGVAGRIENGLRQSLALIGPDGVIFDSTRKTLGAVLPDMTVRDPAQTVIGRIEGGSVFLDDANRVIARRLPDWRLVGPTELPLAIIRAGAILSNDQMPIALYSTTINPVWVLAWFVYFSGLLDRSAEKDMTIR